METGNLKITISTNLKLGTWNLELISPSPTTPQMGQDHASVLRPMPAALHKHFTCPPRLSVNASPYPYSDSYDPDDESIDTDSDRYRSTCRHLYLPTADRFVTSPAFPLFMVKGGRSGNARKSVRIGRGRAAVNGYAASLYHWGHMVSHRVSPGPREGEAQV